MSKNVLGNAFIWSVSNFVKNRSRFLQPFVKLGAIAFVSREGWQAEHKES
jgi:hypothetical protein